MTDDTPLWQQGPPPPWDPKSGELWTPERREAAYEAIRNRPPPRPGPVPAKIPVRVPQDLLVDDVETAYWRAHWPVDVVDGQVLLRTGATTNVLAIEFDAVTPPQMRTTCVIDHGDRSTRTALFVHPGGIAERYSVGGFTVLPDDTTLTLPPSSGRSWSGSMYLGTDLPLYAEHAIRGRMVESLGYVDLSGEAPAVEAVCFGLATTGGITLLNGHPEQGKTMLETAMAFEWARAGKPVLYLDTERKGRDIRRRWAAMGCTPEEERWRLHLVDLAERTDLAEPGGRVGLRKEMQRLIYTLVIVDSLSGLLRLAQVNEQYAVPVARFFDEVLLPVVADSPTALVLSDLPRTRDGEAREPRGSGKLPAIDVAWSVHTEQSFDPNTPGLINLTRRRDRYGVTGSANREFVVKVDGGLRVVEADLAEVLLVDNAARFILDLVGESPWKWTWAQVEEQAKQDGIGPVARLRRRHRELVNQGLVVEERREREERGGVVVTRLLLAVNT